MGNFLKITNVVIFVNILIVSNLTLIVMNVVNLMNVTSRKIFQWGEKIEIKKKILRTL